MLKAAKAALKASGWLALFILSSVVVVAAIGSIGIATENEYVIDGIISCAFVMDWVMGKMEFSSLVNAGWLIKASNFTMLILFLSYVLVLCVAGVKAWRNRDKLKLPRAYTLLFCCGAAALFNVVLEIIAVGVAPFVPSSDSEMLEFAMTLATGGFPYAVFVVSGILAPIIEEVVLRGGVQKALQEINPVFAIIAASAIFGVMHGNLVQGVFAGVFGLLLGYVYYKTDNLLYTIAMHMTVNITGCLIASSGLPEIPVYIGVAIVFILVVFAMSYIKYGRIVIPKEFEKKTIEADVTKGIDAAENATPAVEELRR